MKRRSLIILLLIMCFITIGCGKKSDNKKENKDNNELGIKNQELFNKVDTNEKIGYTIGDPSNGTYNLFIGFIGKDALKSNFVHEIEFENDLLQLSFKNNKYISIRYDWNWYVFDFESGSIIEKNDGRYFDGDLIVYEDGNYLATKSSSGKYILYYVYENSTYLYAVNISYLDSIDDVKNRIKVIRENIQFCSYKKKEGLDNCLDENGNNINYKEYKYVNDIVVEYLASLGLYVDSYKEITEISSGDIVIESVTSLSKDKAKLKIYGTENYDVSDYEVVGSVNGMDIYYKEGNNRVYVKNAENLYTHIYMDLPYELEDTKENYVTVLNDIFKK